MDVFTKRCLEAAADALHDLLVALDEDESGSPEVAALRNVQDGGIIPVYGYLREALDGPEWDEDEDES